MPLAPFLSDSPPSFLTLSSYPWPVFSLWGWVGECIDGLIGGQEEGRRKEGYNEASIHTQMYFFVFKNTSNFFFFLKENKNHLPSHHLERVTFGWIFYSFNFWERQWKHDFFFSFGKSINLLFSTQCCLPRSLNFRMLPKFQEHIFKARSTARILGRGSPSCVLVTQRRERPFSAAITGGVFWGQWVGRNMGGRDTPQMG